MVSRVGVQQQVRDGFRQMGDIPREVTYHHFTGNVVRDIAAGTSTRETVAHTIPYVVKTGLTEQEVDFAQTLNVTAKMLFASLDLPIVPEEDDLIIWEDGVIWEICKYKTDPAEAVRIVYVRTTSTE